MNSILDLNARGVSFSAIGLYALISTESQRIRRAKVSLKSSSLGLSASSSRRAAFTLAVNELVGGGYVSYKHSYGRHDFMLLGGINDFARAGAEEVLEEIWRVWPCSAHRADSLEILAKMTPTKQKYATERAMLAAPSAPHTLPLSVWLAGLK